MNDNNVLTLLGILGVIITKTQITVQLLSCTVMITMLLSVDSTVIVTKIICQLYCRNYHVSSNGSWMIWQSCYIIYYSVIQSPREPTERDEGVERYMACDWFFEVSSDIMFYPV